MIRLKHYYKEFGISANVSEIGFANLKMNHKNAHKSTFSFFAIQKLHAICF